MHDNDFLQFSKKERRGIAALFLLFLAIWVFPELYERYLSPAQSPDTEAFEIRWASIHTEDSLSSGTPEPSSEPQKVAAAGEPPRLFYFDPNTLDEAGWKKLGLSPSQIRTLLRYRNKGGRFRKPEDLQRLYGLSPGQAEQLIPYVEIAGAEIPKPSHWNRPVPGPDSAVRQTLRKTAQVPIEINGADSAAFEALPGIGPVLARRLVNFREKLGGFWSIDQVGETFGMPDSTFQRIRPFLRMDKPGLRKIELNTASADELSLHPYINRKAAREIVSYRQAHGPFADADALSRIQNLDPAVRVKLIPYLSVSKQ